MEIRRFDIAGLVEFSPRIHGDARGYFAEVFRADLFAAHVGPAAFVQDNQSHSAAPGTVRGLHFQTPPHAQGKLVRCLAGAVFDVAVDLRHGSATYGQWAGVELSATRLNALWVPAGFAHGFCTLVPDSIITYKVTDYYSAGHDRGLAWDDPALAIAWPEVANPETLSAKDRVQPRLADLPPVFTLED